MSYVTFSASGIKVDLKRYLSTPEGKAMIQKFAKKPRSEYNFKDFNHEELIEFAINQPKDLEHNEYSQLVRELGARLRIFKRCMDKY